MRRILSADRLKYKMDTTNGKYEDHYFTTNSMEQTSEIILVSGENKDTRNSDLRSDINNPENNFDGFWVCP